MLLFTDRSKQQFQIVNVVSHLRYNEKYMTTGSSRFIFYENLRNKQGF